MKTADYRVIWKKNATNDLLRIHDYIAEQMFKPAAAGKIVENIKDTADRLLSFSPYFPLVNNEYLAKLGYRKMNIGDYIAIFIFLEGNTTVPILRVFNGRQNWMRILIDGAP